MGEINTPRSEQEALKAIDTEVLSRLVEQSMNEERPYALRDLRLDNCGLYVASRVRQYETALAEHGKAKAAKKRAETGYRARRAGSDLVHAVQQMKDRVETEEKEGQFFYVDDLIMPPSHFGERLTVQVSYRWRRTIEDKWAHGSITFVHDVDFRRDYTLPLPTRPTRKPSAAKLERDRQEKLYHEWEHLMKQGLHSVRKYFRDGGDGATIPRTFRARADSYGQGLNNSSTNFWLTQSCVSTK